MALSPDQKGLTEKTPEKGGDKRALPDSEKKKKKTQEETRTDPGNVTITGRGTIVLIKGKVRPKRKKGRLSQ